jgi:uncharacterized protein (AIM24 family)
MTRDEEHLAGGVEAARDTGVDEDFLYHLRRGTELLAAGKNDEARDELERAAHLRPRNLKAHNLLGLAYFKLGLFERAIEVYERLVHESPKDATLRINLGLVHLKAGQTSEAVLQLETAVELVPDRPKALNYLGLAYAQAKAVGKAKRVFERSGNAAMVRRMEATLRGEADAPEADLVTGSDLAPLGWEMNKETAERSATRSAIDGGEPAPSSERFGRSAPLGLSEVVRAGSRDLPVTQPFQLDGETLTLRVDGELRARLPNLLWMRGNIDRQGETKRFRGRVTEQPFGEGQDRVFDLKGHGVVAIARRGLVFTPVDLREEAVYLVESALLAFESSLGYENGRIPGGSFADLALVHLRGNGQAVIRSDGTLCSLVVSEDGPVQMPIERLIGWLGNLTPSLSGTQEDRSVQLQGEGWALWALPT